MGKQKDEPKNVTDAPAETTPTETTTAEQLPEAPAEAAPAPSVEKTITITITRDQIREALEKKFGEGPVLIVYDGSEGSTKGFREPGTDNFEYFIAKQPKPVSGKLAALLIAADRGLTIANNEEPPAAQ
jgi:hypothetical protein